MGSVGKVHKEVKTCIENFDIFYRPFNPLIKNPNYKVGWYSSFDLFLLYDRNDIRHKRVVKYFGDGEENKIKALNYIKSREIKIEFLQKKFDFKKI